MACELCKLQKTCTPLLHGYRTFTPLLELGGIILIVEIIDSSQRGMFLEMFMKIKLHQASKKSNLDAADRFRKAEE
ncbi:hypothetical protein RJT34_29760 [Clitoria ternatea]|uniref:Uncharacterized protein n=1 Tax=Clitoria ternatea TaxID=43366 RepID=A0AAN9ERJ0_CLITE